MVAENPRTVRLRCLGCSQTLDIAHDTVEVGCGACGASMAVERSGATVRLKMGQDAGPHLPERPDDIDIGAVESALDELNEARDSIGYLELKRAEIAYAVRTENSGRALKVNLLSFGALSYLFLGIGSLWMFLDALDAYAGKQFELVDSSKAVVMVSVVVLFLLPFFGVLVYAQRLHNEETIWSRDLPWRIADATKSFDAQIGLLRDRIGEIENRIPDVVSRRAWGGPTHLAAHSPRLRDRDSINRTLDDLRARLARHAYGLKKRKEMICADFSRDLRKLVLSPAVLGLIIPYAALAAWYFGGWFGSAGFGWLALMHLVAVFGPIAAGIAVMRKATERDKLLRAAEVNVENDHFKRYRERIAELEGRLREQA